MTNHPMKTLPRLAACLMLFAAQSCATVFNSGSQSTIATPTGDKDNIKIEVATPHGSYRSQLPTTIVTSPSSFSETTIMVKDKCYEETQIIVGKSITGSFWVNFLFGLGFPVAMLIDFLDGNMWKMDRQVVVPLNPKPFCTK